MTPDRLRHLIAISGDDRLTISRMLGYRSENTIRQCEAGKQTLSPDRAARLESYARFRARQIAALEAWHTRYPAPAGSARTTKGNPNNA